jgi:hypothetical protein
MKPYSAKPVLLRFGLPVYAALCLSSSQAFGIIIDADMTPQYVAEHNREFKVEVTKRDDKVEFQITRIAPKRRFWIAELVIREDGHVIVQCRVAPWPQEGRSPKQNQVSYALTVSPDVTSESEFILSEYALGTPGDLPLPGPKLFHFRLHKFVAGAKVAQ